MLSDFAARANAWRALTRATIVPLERPDRLARAMLAALPYGSGLLGAVAASVARYPDARALVTTDETVSYEALWDRSSTLAAALAEAGATGDSRVGILCRNSPMFGYALLACVKLGADVVLLNTGLGQFQLAETIAGEAVDWVLHDDEFAEMLAVPQAFGTAELSVLIAGPPLRRIPPPQRQSRLVILTSGTTGRPKGATRPSNSSAAASAAALLGRIPLRARDTFVVPAPFFHAWGLGALLVGWGLAATVVTDPQFDAVRTLHQVERHQASALFAVPTMLQRICCLPPPVLAAADTDSLRAVVSSGSALPGVVATELLDRFGPVLYNVYGSTEIATATVASPVDLRAAPTTAGRPPPGVRVEVLDDAHRPVSAPEHGRIFVGSSARFDGYSDGGGKESARGLLATGDVGHFDAQGRLFVDGRVDDMIVSGGENVYPREVEEVLNEHDRIHEAVVVGVSDDSFGQALKAVVVCAAGERLDPGELTAYVAQRLARYKVPRIIEFRDELPRTATGKVLRREVR